MLTKNIEIVNGIIKRRDVYQPDQIQGPKAVRTENVSKLTVTITNGKTFDADEISQNRISRTIQAMEYSGTASVNWKLADNTMDLITLAEFKEVLQTALEAQAALWFQ